MAGIEQAQENMRDFGLAAQAPPQPDLSQYDAEGMRAIARGFENLNATMFSIRERKAEAKNYVDVAEADTAMMKLRGEFDKWKLANPDPSGWEEKWNSLSTNFSNTYLSDKDISPKARDEITAKMNAFTTREAIAVGVDSVKGQVQKARAAVRANIDFAISRGDRATAMKNLQIAEDEGWMYPDEVMRERLRLENAIEDQKTDKLNATVSAYVDRGNITLALEAVREAAKDWLDEDEANEQIASLERQKIYVENVEALNQEAARNPKEVYANILNGKDDGIYNLTPVDRNEFINKLAAQFAAENAAIATRLVRTNPTVADLDQDPDYGMLPVDIQEDVRKRINEGALNDLEEYWNFKSKIELLDPAAPDYGTMLNLYQGEVALKFSGAKYDTLTAMIQDAQENPTPPSIPARILSEGLQIFDESLKNGSLGTYEYEFDEIKYNQILDAEGNKTGEYGYFVVDENAPTELRYAQNYKKFLFFGVGGFRPVRSDYKGKEGDIFYRQIQLTREQELEFANDKETLYTDRIAKRAIDEKALQAKEIVEVEVEAGQITSGPQVLSRMDELTNRDRQAEADQILNKAAGRKQPIEQELEKVIKRASEPLVRAVPVTPTDLEDDADSGEEEEDQRIFYGPDGAIFTGDDTDSSEQSEDTDRSNQNEDTSMRILGTTGTMIVPGSNPGQEPDDALFPRGLRPKN